MKRNGKDVEGSDQVFIYDIIVTSSWIEEKRLKYKQEVCCVIFDKLCDYRISQEID
jgi:hypothetical protein